MQMTRELLFEDGAFFPSCHASTVLPLDDGTVLVCYFAGSREGADDVGIWLSRRVAGHWEAPRRIAKVKDQAHWNPVLMPITGGVRLIFKVGKSVPVWKSWTMTSSNGGVTWSDPEPLPAPNDAHGPVRSKPLILTDGSMLAPDSRETEQNWIVRVDTSFDLGGSFPASSKIPIRTVPKGDPKLLEQKANGILPDAIEGKGAIQPTLWTSAPGKIHALMRTTGGYIFRSDSDDYGRSWCTAYNTGLPNNNSGIDIVKAENRLFLAMNPVGRDWGERTPLVIMISSDNGATFRDFVTLEDMRYDPKLSPEPDGSPNAEFSYPAIVAKAGKLHVTYTVCRRQIAYREIIL